MEIASSDEFTAEGALRTHAADVLLKLSRLSLAAAIIFLPMHYRWVLYPRPLPPVYEDYTSFFLYLSDIPLLMSIVLWLASLGILPRWVSLRPRWLTIVLGALLILSTTSTVFSFDVQLSLYSTARLCLLFGLYLYLINHPPNLRILLVSLGIQVFIQSVVGVAQVLQQGSLGLTIFQELTLDSQALGTSIVWVEGVRSLRAYGLTDHPNILGGSLAFALLLLSAGYLISQPARRTWLGSLIALGSLALLVTFSRAAWLGLSVGLVGIALWMGVNRNKPFLSRLAGLWGGALLILIPFLWINAANISTRLNLDGSFTAATPENQSVNERGLLLGEAVRIMLRYPLVGVGVGAYPVAFHELVPNYAFAFQPPHMAAAASAAETGLPGAAAYIAALLVPWYFLIRNRQRLRSSVPMAGVSAALLAISIVSLFDYYPWLLNPGRLWHWLIWGLWGAWYQLSLEGKMHA